MLQIKVEDLYIIKKETIAKALFYIGMVIAYLGSLNPWVMWPIGPLYVFPSFFFIALSMAISRNLQRPLFSRKEFLPASLAVAILEIYLLIINDANINGFIVNLVHIAIFYSIFKVNTELMIRFCDIMCRIMGLILCVSIPFFVLYYIGFPLPSQNAEFGDGLYSYTNYFFFLVDDRDLFSIFPRFSCIFLEPGHLGTATVLLLMTQFGKWKKWYNSIMIVATLITFSLAAYVLFVIIIFLNLWNQGKRFVSRLIYVIIATASITIGAFFYNGGENLLHDLILIRLEINDGDMVGNNRVTDDFDSEFESFLKSSDILFGRDMDKESSGNSGYKVYIYENGFIGLFLVFIFYACWMIYGTNKRALFSSLLIAALTFIVRGYPLWYCNFIPLYSLIFTPSFLISNTKGAEGEQS